MPLGVFLGGAFTLMRYWLVRTGDYGSIASARIKQALMSILVQLSCFKLGGIALVIGQTSGQLAGLVSCDTVLIY